MKKNGDNSGFVLFDLGMCLCYVCVVQDIMLKQLVFKVGCLESLLLKLENEVVLFLLVMLYWFVSVLEINILDLMVESWVVDLLVLKLEQCICKWFMYCNKKGGIVLENLIYYYKGGLLQGNIYIIESGVVSDGQIEYYGEEMGYVLEGEIVLYLGEEIYIFSVGDFFYFFSNVFYGYCNIGQLVVKVLWVNMLVIF